MKIKTLIAASFLTALASACTDVAVSDTDRNAPLIPPEISQQGMDHEDPPIYIKQASVDEELQKTRVTIKTTGQSLASVLSSTLPNIRVHVVDSNVNLARNIQLFVNDASLGEFLDYLSEHTGYDFSLDADQLKVSSVATRQWSLAAFSSARKATASVGDAGGNGGGQSPQAGSQSSQGASGASSSLNGNTGTASTSTNASKVTITEDQDEWDLSLIHI